jgi:23S rRNA pseudouridine2605 synthase
MIPHPRPGGNNAGVKERIQKVLANAGVASRRNIEEMVLQGRVAVNGRVVTELPVLIDPESDRVSVDDEPLKLRGKQGGGGQRYYLLMNKPRGVYSTNVSQGEQVRAIDLLPPDFPTRVYPVGRLDAESTGLLLLTNDGALTNHLTHPRFGVPKTYRAIVDGTVSDDDLRELEKGVWLSDERSGQGFKARTHHIRVTKRIREKGRGEKTILEVTLREGRNRQVRRMLAKIGHKVRDLSRIKIGPLTLHGLPPGKFRPLTPRELRELREFGRKGTPRGRERKVAAERDE